MPAQHGALRDPWVSWMDDHQRSAWCMPGHSDCCMLRNSACLESLFFLQAEVLILSGLSRDTPKSAEALAMSNAGHC